MTAQRAADSVPALGTQPFTIDTSEPRDNRAGPGRQGHFILSIMKMLGSSDGPRPSSAAPRDGAQRSYAGSGPHRHRGSAHWGALSRRVYPVKELLPVMVRVYGVHASTFLRPFAPPGFPGICATMDALTSGRVSVPGQTSLLNVTSPSNHSVPNHPVPPCSRFYYNTPMLFQRCRLPACRPCKCPVDPVAGYTKLPRGSRY